MYLSDIRLVTFLLKAPFMLYSYKQNEVNSNVREHIGFFQI